MDTIQQLRIIDYRNELLVELQGTDERGEVDVLTYHFNYEGEEMVSPKEPIDDAHRTEIETGLQEDGYRIA